jgi:DNA ligase D-like protein (predicted 3'-phosphoesterase)
MDLSEYRRKRDFSKTPEPKGETVEPRTWAPLRFAVQKHAARRLHYDFRLEMNGVLKSWAIPRGPSLDPAEKRLAVHVEDHPLDYGEFEGVIPEKEYGAGTCCCGIAVRGCRSIPDPEAAYRKGLLRFTLQGEKLHGNWALVRMAAEAAGKRRENWPLIRERAEAAVPQSGDAVVADNPLSVATGRSIDAIANDQDWVWHSNRSTARSAMWAISRSRPRRSAAIAEAQRAPSTKCHRRYRCARVQECLHERDGSRNYSQLVQIDNNHWEAARRRILWLGLFELQLDGQPVAPIREVPTAHLIPFGRDDPRLGAGLIERFARFGQFHFFETIRD